MKYKLQHKKKIYKSTLNNSKWAVSQLKEKRETENYNRVKQNLNYIETRYNKYKSTMGELKTRNNNSCNRDIREFKATTQKTVDKWKNCNMIKTKVNTTDLEIL
jgi:hypothetical protein